MDAYSHKVAAWMHHPSAFAVFRFPSFFASWGDVWPHQPPASEFPEQFAASIDEVSSFAWTLALTGSIHSASSLFSWLAALVQRRYSRRPCIKH